MPDVTLTPVAGDPWNGGARELDPATSPPLTVSLGRPTAVEQGATTADPTDYTPQAPLPQAAATAGQVAAAGQSLASGHAFGDYQRWQHPDGGSDWRDYVSAPGVAAQFADALQRPVTTNPVGDAAALGKGVADSLGDVASFAHDYLNGAYGTAPEDAFSRENLARAMPHVANALGLMGGAGLPMAEEGAAGAMGGKLFSQGAQYQGALADLKAAAPTAAQTAAHDDIMAELNKLLGKAPAAPAAAAVAQPSIEDELAASLGKPVGSLADAKKAAVQPFNLAAQAPRTRTVDPDAASWRLYHGTGAPEDFSRFDPTIEGGHTSGAERGAVFFSPDPYEADTYSAPQRGYDSVEHHVPGMAGSRILPVTMTPGNTGLYDLNTLFEAHDPRFMAEMSKAGTGVGYDPDSFAAMVQRERDNRAYTNGTFARQEAAEPGSTAGLKWNNQFPLSLRGHEAAIAMARQDGRDTAIIRGLAESAGGDQIVALQPGHVHSAIDGSLLYSRGDGAAPMALAGALDRQGAGEAGNALTGAGSVSPGFTVYHGSPHRFDAFDMSKVGTGEGAQAYGHGMYFTDTEDVARGYRDALSGWNINGKPASPTNPNHLAATALAQNQGSVHGAVNDLGAVRDAAPTAGQRRAANQALDMLWQNQAPGARYKPTSAGHMYEVGVNADPDHFIDYDKPLSQQTPAVQSMLAAHRPTLDWYRDGEFSTFNPQDTSEYTGADLYSALQEKAYQEAGGEFSLQRHEASKAAAAQQLAQAGIPGIRYLDGDSRGAGAGTSNYVLFDPARDAQIRRIYATGLPIPGAAPEAQGQPQPVTQAQALAAMLRAGVGR